MDDKKQQSSCLQYLTHHVQTVKKSKLLQTLEQEIKIYKLCPEKLTNIGNIK